MSILEALENFPEQCKEGFELTDISVDKKNKIAVVGMGGSAIAGDILNCLIDNEVVTVRNYDLPKFIDKDFLVFIISYSGNTEETLSCFDQAVKKGLSIVTVSSGGKLEELSKEKNIKHIKLPSGVQPRSGIGYIFFSLLKVLKNSGIIEFNELKLEDVKDEAKKIAEKINGKIPIIYSSEKLKGISYRFKTQVNENPKFLAFTSVIPEMNHNEINALESADGFIGIFLEDQDDHERIKKRFDFTKRMFKDFIEIKSKGENKLSRIFYLISMGDWISYYLAELNNIDSTPVEVIEKLKKELSK